MFTLNRIAIAKQMPIIINGVKSKKLITQLS